MSNHPSSGRLEIYLGPMFSGKSSRLLHDLSTFADIGLKVLYINHIDDIRDTKGDNIVSTHNSQYNGLSKKIKSAKISFLKEVNVEDYDIIGVDEAQFFEDLVPMVIDWVENKKKYVICVGLDGDAFRRPFGHLLELIPYSDFVEKLKAKCHICLNEAKDRGFGRLKEAPFTKRLFINDDSNKEQKLIGGADKYIAVCRYHS